MVSWMDHPSSQHRPFAVRTTSWLAISGAPLPDFTLFLPPSLLCFTNSASFLFLLLLKLHPCNLSFRSPQQVSSRVCFPPCTVHDFLKSIKPSELKVQTTILLPAIMLCHFFLLSLFSAVCLASCWLPRQAFLDVILCLSLLIAATWSSTSTNTCMLMAKKKKEGGGGAGMRRWANSNGGSSCLHTLWNT